MIKAGYNDLRIELWLRLREAGEIAWITKQGKAIPLKEMTTTHLVNAIKIFNRNENNLAEYLEALSSIGDMDF